ncbi:NAD-dependent succinate-semialdehyde dehydrogenase [Sphingomonas sp. S2-65]|uniref:NAD-dependent succinate-semialdehyde dehydrogenase n=1 Tax=Sphingomonas sp. S2-65 TaxID=2903960 RepID=UPI001F34CB53|nr:NAD-dependent succinate-semialdehyde dehydrogenase [Sphingomonas sp. S2-65]UYY58065.1 NAD-dependent succinate-semialdehyde dehydrogenase [Sphingomonas sp. S2-65]
MAYRTTNPATGKVEKSFESITDDALAAILDETARCYRDDWPHRAVSERAAILKRAAKIIREEQQVLAETMSRDMGKLVPQAIGELQLSAAILDYYADTAADFLAPKPLPDAPGATLHAQPLGILLAVEPWNFPFFQLARVAGPQLMVGNVVVAKHASNVPACALAFEDVMRRAGVPAGAYANLFVTTDQIGAIIDDPRVRGVTLTGSEKAGASVAERAARNLKKSVLELGGSDPMIVLEDAPVEATVLNAMVGKMNNTGQSCVATKRMIVVGEERGKLFLEAMKAAMGSLKPGDPLDPKTSLGPVSSEGALQGLLKQIEEAKAAGAEIALGGSRIDRTGSYLEPTILANIGKDNPVYSQEIFGPVLSFYVVPDEAAAVALANDVPFGLGGSVFTGDLKRGERVALAIESGMAFVNNPTWSTPQMPFGGIKNSGYGRELSQLGFGEFVNWKLVAVSPPGALPPGADAAG